MAVDPLIARLNPNELRTFFSPLIPTIVELGLKVSEIPLPPRQTAIKDEGTYVSDYA
jgi:hypothetical protein